MHAYHLPKRSFRSRITNVVSLLHYIKCVRLGNSLFISVRYKNKMQTRFMHRLNQLSSQLLNATSEANEVQLTGRSAIDENIGELDFSEDGFHCNFVGKNIFVA